MDTTASPCSIGALDDNQCCQQCCCMLFAVPYNDSFILEALIAAHRLRHNVEGASTLKYVLPLVRPQPKITTPWATPWVSCCTGSRWRHSLEFTCPYAAETWPQCRRCQLTRSVSHPIHSSHLTSLHHQTPCRPWWLLQTHPLQQSQLHTDVGVELGTGQEPRIKHCVHVHSSLASVVRQTLMTLQLGFCATCE